MVCLRYTLLPALLALPLLSYTIAAPALNGRHLQRRQDSLTDDPIVEEEEDDSGGDVDTTSPDLATTASTSSSSGTIVVIVDTTTSSTTSVDTLVTSSTTSDNTVATSSTTSVNTVATSSTTSVDTTTNTSVSVDTLTNTSSSSSSTSMIVVSTTSSPGDNTVTITSPPNPPLTVTTSAGPLPTNGGGSTVPTGSGVQYLIDLNNYYKTLTPSSPCVIGDMVCIGNSFAQCFNDGTSLRYVVYPACNTGTICRAYQGAIGGVPTCGWPFDAGNGGNSGGGGGGNISPPDPINPTVLQQNAIDAQKLNSAFRTKKATDACDPYAIACVEGQVGQCVENKWVLQTCGVANNGTVPYGSSVDTGHQVPNNGTVPTTPSCFALPLVENLAGTFIGCDTYADADTRMSAAGVNGGVYGDNYHPTPSRRSFRIRDDSAAINLQNARDAQALNKKWASYNQYSNCNDRGIACVAGQVASCNGIQFEMKSCSTGSSCFALPLVGVKGTTVHCENPDTANARFVAAGVTGGPSGA